MNWTTQDQVCNLRGRVYELEKQVHQLAVLVAKQREQNPLKDFGEEPEKSGTLGTVEVDYALHIEFLNELARLREENRDLREQLGEAHRNAGAVVLLMKQVVRSGE